MKSQILFVLFLSTLVGCGVGGGSRSTVGIKGKVTMDGKPLDEGYILFEPKDGKGASATATILGGNYESRVEPGLKIVRINFPKVIGTEVVYPGSPDSPTREIRDEQIPAKYNSASRLEKDLTEVTGSVDFDLSSK